MRRFPLIFFLLLSVLSRAQNPTDSLALAKADSTADSYVIGLALKGLESIAAEPVEVKIRACDRLLESAGDDQQFRDKVAVELYRYYMNSPQMGVEAIPIHLTDKWFVPGLAQMPDELELMNAKIFAQFNRNSLVGCEAPSLELTAEDGSKVQAIGGKSDKYRVLYFYSPDCAKCRHESPLLGDFLRRSDMPLDVVTVCAGYGDWKKYCREYFPSDNVRNFTDPEVTSDYQMKYGVIQTPKLFLIGRNGRILGRGLDTKALEQLLELQKAADEYQYGNEKSSALFDGILPAEDSLKLEDVTTLAGYLEKQTLPDGKTLAFKQMIGDLLYWLTSRRGSAAKAGAAFVADSLILARPDIWDDPMDSLKVVGLASMLSALNSRAAVGSPVPELTLPATMLKGKREKQGKWDISRLGNDCYIMFYTEGCANCERDRSALRDEVRKDKKKRALLVDMDQLMSGNGSLAFTLLDSFDLTTLPYIILADKSGIIRARYLTASDL